MNSKTLTEFIGTFFLVLTIGLAVAAGTPFAALAIGSALMVMVYMGGAISGAHYNPAVTVALTLRGASATRQLAPYVTAQVTGAILAAFVVRFMTGRTFAPAPNPEAGILAALLGEILLTFALALVVLNVATAPQTQGNSYFGLAIGFTVTVGALTVGPISGGAFNPAVGIGPILVEAVFGGRSFMNLWLYIVGPLAGGVGAAYVFKLQHR